MFDTLRVICMIWWCMVLFHHLHADIQCTGSEAGKSPITNVKINLRKMELSWESSKNFSMYNCIIVLSNTESIHQEGHSPVCRFPMELNEVLHKGVHFTIEVPNTNISEKCIFTPGGVNGSAIENFSCVIYNISLMNCTWQAGRNAPGDTQYFLYWQNLKYGDSVECELYIKDENGRNLGCRFQNVIIWDKSTYFFMDGYSKDSSIQFYDEYINLYEIEILTPPLNVTANCIGGSSGCIITWQTPLRSHMVEAHCFEYKVSIQKKDESKEEKNDVCVRNNRYEFQNYNKEKEYILKIRARGINCELSSNWGEWSEPIEFGGGKGSFLFVILFGIALGTISATLLHYCLFKRYCSFKSIFYPVPKPRVKLSASVDEDMKAEYINLQKNICAEELTTVEEMT